MAGALRWEIVAPRSDLETAWTLASRVGDRELAALAAVWSIRRRDRDADRIWLARALEAASDRRSWVRARVLLEGATLDVVDGKPGTALDEGFEIAESIGAGDLVAAFALWRVLHVLDVHGPTVRFRHRSGTWRATAQDPGVARSVAIAYLTTPTGEQIPLVAHEP